MILALGARGPEFNSRNAPTDVLLLFYIPEHNLPYVERSTTKPKFAYMSDHTFKYTSLWDFQALSLGGGQKHWMWIILVKSTKIVGGIAKVCQIKRQKNSWAFGLVVWFSLWVREVPSSIFRMPQPMCYFFLKMLLHNLPPRTQMHQHVRSNLCTHIFNRFSSTKLHAEKALNMDHSSKVN